MMIVHATVDEKDAQRGWLGQNKWNESFVLSLLYSLEKFFLARIFKDTLGESEKRRRRRLKTWLRYEGGTQLLLAPVKHKEYILLLFAQRVEIIL